VVAGVGEKGPRDRALLIDRIRSPQREGPNLPNTAYLSPAYLAVSKWLYGSYIIISAAYMVGAAGLEPATR
jgi:hypothetical protein